MDPNDGDGVFYAADDHEADSRRRWRSLVDRDDLAGDRETGVAAHLGARGFLYRPGQFLSHVDDAERVGNLLDHCGVDPRPFPRRTADPKGLVSEQIVRWRLPVHVPVPNALACLRTIRAGRDRELRVGPNHVFFGCQGWVKFGPGGSPIPVSRPTFGEDDYVLDGDAGRGVQIAVMDTGIMRDAGTVHPILAGRYAEPDSRERTVGDFDPLLAADGELLALEAGHGTFIAGIIATWAPGARVNHEASLYPNGSTDEVMLAEDLPDALAGAHLVNLALGGYTEDDRPPLTLATMLESVPRDVVVVAAAGNEGTTRPFWPAAFDTVLGVGAVRVRPSGQVEPAPFTNHGEWVGCCADGVDVVSTFPRGTHRTEDGDIRSFDGMARWSGTSFAVARVAALVAAAVTIWQCANAREAADRLLATAPMRLPGLGPFLAPGILRDR